VRIDDDHKDDPMDRPRQPQTRSVQLTVMATPSASLADALAEARRLERTATASIARPTDQLGALRLESAGA
jgi:hypothetical protein